MKRSKRRRNVFVVLVILMIAIGVILLPPCRRFVTVTVGNQYNRVFAVPMTQYQAVLSDAQILREMYSENTRLQVRMQNYNLLKARLLESRSESARLKEMIQFESKVGWHLLPARINGRSAATWSSKLTVDVGRSDGIQPNMIVLSPKGDLVGRISSVTSNQATVTLITSTVSRDGVSATIEDGAQQFSGIVLGSTTTHNLLDMAFVSPLAQIKKGADVVTSGIGGIYPKGIKIGKVVSVSQGVQGLTQTAGVKPNAKLDYLQDVFIILS